MHACMYTFTYVCSQASSCLLPGIYFHSTSSTTSGANPLPTDDIMRRRPWSVETIVGFRDNIHRSLGVDEKTPGFSKIYGATCTEVFRNICFGIRAGVDFD